MCKILLSLLAFFSLQAVALEQGGSCSSSTKLPSQFTCFEGEILDCNESQPQMGYVACGSAKNDRLSAELDKRYKSLLNKLKKPAQHGQDFTRASISLTESQKSWEQFIKADCVVENSLLGTGNASAGVAVDCDYTHLKERIERLKYLEEYLP